MENKIKFKVEDDGLKPCPFCGGVAFLWPTITGFKISCRDKDCCSFPARSDVFIKDRDKAIERWNERA